MGLVGFNKVSCASCGRRFYSRQKDLLRGSAAKKSPVEGADKENAEKETSTFASLIRQIEAAERHSGLERKPNGKPASPASEPATPPDQPAPRAESPSEPEPVQASPAPAQEVQPVEEVKRAEEMEEAEEETGADLQEVELESRVIELPYSSLEVREEEEAPAAKEKGSARGAAPEEARPDRPDEEEARPEKEEEEEWNVEAQSKEKPTPERLNNYDRLTLMPRKRKK